VWPPVDEPWKTVALELAATLRRLRYRVDMHVVPGDVRLAYLSRPDRDPRYAQFVSQRVGNIQAHPFWGPMFGQMWVR
jgi:hypothetical protein